MDGHSRRTKWPRGPVNPGGKTVSELGGIGGQRDALRVDCPAELGANVVPWNAWRVNCSAELGGNVA